MSVELPTPKTLPDTSDSHHIMTESGSKGTTSSPECIATGSGVQCTSGLQCTVCSGVQSIFSEGREDEDSRMQNPEIAILPKFRCDNSELAKVDAATEAAVNLSVLFAHPVVLEKVDVEPELDTEPDRFKLEAFSRDAVLTASDSEMEPNDQHNDTWAGRCQESGWGERGLWSGGALQLEAEHSFHEMKVTHLHLQH